MDIIKEFSASIRVVIDRLKKELSGIRAGRPSTALIEDLKAECYGAQTPLKQIGSVSVIPPRQIFVQVWDKSVIGAVVAAIQAAGVSGSVTAEANGVRVSLPELSTERRAELVKQTKKVSEEFRIELRHARDEANKRVEAAEKAGDITEDQRFKLREGVQKETDAANKEIESVLEQKMKEISE